MQPQDKIIPTQSNQSSDKLLSLIELLSEQPEPIRLQDISRLSGLNPSTALRFINALSRRGYLAQDADTGRYYLTFKICGLAQSISSHMSVRKIALPFLRELSNVFSESCNLAVESNMSVLYVEVASSQNRTLVSTQRIGNAAALHCTGVGKLFLSQYPSDKLTGLLGQRPLEAFTEHTITDPQALGRELAHVRAVGFAYDNEECEDGTRCIAAPVRDFTGKIVAGISVSGPAVRMSDEHIAEHLPSLLDCTKQISLRLGWREGA
ncbi:MAG: IclR family transcriptional regulator [Oscillospiraceae bacterium]|nr:IclR family transcriptional regulator [Oscillospiraceae bacterium]